MGLNSLKQLLLKKTDNEELSQYIDLLDDSNFMGFVFESLQKMAAINQNDKSNHTINWAAKHLLPAHHEMYKDALSHHASSYNAALKSGNTTLADEHMKQTMKLLNFGTRLGKHSYKDHNDKHTTGSDKLNVEAVPDQPWQKNGRKQPRGAFGWTDAADYNHLRQSPHGHGPYASEINKHRKEGNDFTSGWPIEQTKVNGKHINIDHEQESSGAYQSHAFDSHPIMEYYDKAQHKMTDKDHMNFIDEATKWHAPDNPNVNKWFDKQENKKSDFTGDSPSKQVHPELVDFPEGADHDMHNPSKHKLRLDHALKNPSIYHSPTTSKDKKRAKAANTIEAISDTKIKGEA